MSRRPAPAALLACLALALVGCQSPGTADLHRTIDAQKHELAAKDNELAGRQATIAELRERLLRAQNFDPDRMQRVYYPVEIRLASLTGGADYDGKPGDDGVTVYVQPIDRDGDAIKAAGEIHIQLFDLASSSDRPAGSLPGVLVGECVLSVDQAAKCWYGKLMTQHYTVKCPWKSGPPAHDEITVRATFTDYLTTNVMTAQTVCKVRLPITAP